MSEAVYNYVQDKPFTLYYDVNHRINIGFHIEVNKEDFLEALERLLDITVIDNKQLPEVTMSSIGTDLIEVGDRIWSTQVLDGDMHGVYFLLALEKFKKTERELEREEELDKLEEVCYSQGIDVLNRDAIAKLYDGGLRKQ